MSTQKLIENLSSDAGTDIIGDWKLHYGGEGDFWVWGNLGGGTVYLQATLDESLSPLPIATICGCESSDASTTVANVSKFYLASETKIRAVLLNTTSSSSGVNVRINT